MPVLEHDGGFWAGPYRRIRELRAASLPSWLPPLAELYAELGTDFDLSLDLKDPAAIPAVLDVAARAEATSRLWLCGSLPALRECRQRSSEVRLANSTTLRGVPAGRLAATLAAAGIDAVNLRAPEWTPLRVQAFHERGVLAFAWDVQQDVLLDRLLADGCDAVYSDSWNLLLRASHG